VLIPFGNSHLKVEVGTPTPVKIEGAPNGCLKTIALAYDEEAPACRLLMANGNEVGNTSDIALLEATDDPARFVFRRRLTHASVDDVLGYEDPTVFRHLDKLCIAATKVEPSQMFYGGSWRAGIDVLVLKDGKLVDQGEHGWTIGDRFYENLSFIKELEVVAHPHDQGVKRLFFEVGGPGLRPFVAQAELQDWRMGIISPWLEPRPWRRGQSQLWDSVATSTGPVLALEEDLFLMFYNGRTQGFFVLPNGEISWQPEWACGLALFRYDGVLVTEPQIVWRSDEPLVRDETRQIGYDSQVIYFASSLRRVGNNRVILYGHAADEHIVAHEVTVTAVK
jgi:hypothetical protein